MEIHVLHYYLFIIMPDIKKSLVDKRRRTENGTRFGLDSDERASWREIRTETCTCSAG